MLTSCSIPISNEQRVQELIDVAMENADPIGATGTGIDVMLIWWSMRKTPMQTKIFFVRRKVTLWL